MWKRKSIPRVLQTYTKSPPRTPDNIPALGEYPSRELQQHPKSSLRFVVGHERATWSHRSSKSSPCTTFVLQKTDFRAARAPDVLCVLPLYYKRSTFKPPELLRTSLVALAERTYEEILIMKPRRCSRMRSGAPLDITCEICSVPASSGSAGVSASMHRSASR